MLRMFGDFRIVAPLYLQLARLRSVTDVYMYQFSRVSPLSRSIWGGAAHTAEIPYVFDNITSEPSQFEELDHALSRAMAEAWVQFAKTGNPNGAGLPQWPAYRSPDYRFLDYGDERPSAPTPEVRRLDFFQRVLETMRRSTTPGAPLK